MSSRWSKRSLNSMKTSSASKCVNSAKCLLSAGRGASSPPGVRVLSTERLGNTVDVAKSGHGGLEIELL